MNKSDLISAFYPSWEDCLKNAAKIVKTIIAGLTGVFKNGVA